MRLHLSVRPTKQKGAFLVVATILLLVLSSLGVSLMSMAISSSRASRNYSDYVIANIRAISMAGYGNRIIDSFTEGQWPGPGTCNSAATCNVIDNTFPRNGRPILPWEIGSSIANIPTYKGTQNNTWWTTNAFGYEGTFIGSGVSRVLVKLLSTNTATQPFTHTYQIIGYSTDNNGVAAATSEIFLNWYSFRPDPYPTTGSNLWGSSSCSGGCPYGQCCNGGVCGASNGSCSTASSTFVPPGWLCSDYFVTGLGYGSGTCTNATARVLDVFYYARPAQLELERWYLDNGTVASINNAGSLSFDQTYVGNTSIEALRMGPLCAMHAVFSHAGFGIGGTAGISFYFNTINPDGTFNWGCRQAGSPLPSMTMLPPYCGVAGSQGTNPYCNCPGCPGSTVIVP